MGTKSDQVGAGSPERAAEDETELKKSQLKSEIRSTREDMSHTVGQIEQKLNPERLKNEALEQFEELKQKVKAELKEEFSQAKEKVRQELHEAKGAVREATIGKVEHMVHDARDTVSGVGSSIVDTIKANPVPAALAGLSLAWLFMDRRNGTWRSPQLRGDWRRKLQRESYAQEYGRSRGYGEDGERDGWRHDVRNGVDAVGEQIHRVQDKASGMAEQVQRRAGQLAHDVGNKAEQLAQQTQETVSHLAGEAAREARQVEAYVERTMRENPVAVGAVVLALGAAAGLALPRTRVEDEFMGETRDELFEQANELAHDAVEKAEHAAQDFTGKIGEQPRS
jgi:hypothetical protein